MRKRCHKSDPWKHTHSTKLAKNLLHKPSLSSNLILPFSLVHCSFVRLNAVILYGYLSDHCSNVEAPTTGPWLALE